MLFPESLEQGSGPILAGAVTDVSPAAIRGQRGLRAKHER